jgi:ribosomal protein L37AE/L43A
MKRYVKNCPKCRATNSFVWNAKLKRWECQFCSYTSEKNPPLDQTKLGELLDSFASI